MSGLLLSNRKEERGVSDGRPYSTGFCWPIGGETRLSLLTGLLVFAELFPYSNPGMPNGKFTGFPVGFVKE